MRNGTRKGIFGLTVAAALVFGAAQALAAPAEATGAARCTQGTCNSRCVSLGYDAGTCVGATCTCLRAS